MINIFHLVALEWGRLQFSNYTLTIAGDGRRLEDLEAVRGIEGGDLAMWELGQEFGLLVVLEVDVVLGEVELEPSERGGCADLVDRSLYRVHERIFWGQLLEIHVHACPEPVPGSSRAYRWTTFWRG